LDVKTDTDGRMDLGTRPPGVCGVCRGFVSAASVLCPKCDAPHHRDCWVYNQGCAVFACSPRASDPLDKKERSDSSAPMSGPGRSAHRARRVAATTSVLAAIAGLASVLTAPRSPVDPVCSPVAATRDVAVGASVRPTSPPRPRPMPAAPAPAAIAAHELAIILEAPARSWSTWSSARVRSPDEKWSAWVEGWSRYPMSEGAAGPELRRIHHAVLQVRRASAGSDRPRVVATAGSEEAPDHELSHMEIVAWSPDSRRILCRHVGGIDETCNWGYELVEARLDGPARPVIGERAARRLRARKLEFAVHEDDAEDCVPTRVLGYSRRGRVLLEFGRRLQVGDAVRFRWQTWEIDVDRQTIHPISTRIAEQETDGDGFGC
jgi:hypothetical protein